MDNFQTLDPRKQELLEARFLGMRSTSNPAGGSGGPAMSSGGTSHSVPPACNMMATSQLHQQQQQPSPSSLNASLAAATAAALAGPPQFNSAASYSAAAPTPVNNHAGSGGSGSSGSSGYSNPNQPAQQYAGGGERPSGPGGQPTHLQQHQPGMNDGSNMSTGSSDREMRPDPPGLEDNRTPERSHRNNSSGATAPSAPSAPSTPTERKRRRKNNATDESGVPSGMSHPSVLVFCFFVVVAVFFHIRWSTFG